MEWIVAICFIVYTAVYVDDTLSKSPDCEHCSQETCIEAYDNLKGCKIDKNKTPHVIKVK